MTQFVLDGVFSMCFGIFVSPCNSFLNHPWIIDSVASHHVTSLFSIFFCIVDGSSLYVAGTGSIPLRFYFPLPSVFHVSNFRLNLVSVNHITKALNCRVTFLPFIVVLRKTIVETLGIRNYTLWMLIHQLPLPLSRHLLHHQ